MFRGSCAFKYIRHFISGNKCELLARRVELITNIVCGPYNMNGIIFHEPIHGIREYGYRMYSLPAL